ncbi:enoyl-CoA hydratase [Pseudonocardia sp. K10HN5]|uniref:Enoyl-CoA hydratase n=1 Tax=Pseudonocardia acidicola TaxID=2724939 RepID=A0ABX1SFR5_9PSEU|nr:enoyl-CoA hydratase [Pseudonocardia acidicola]NMH99387.1 enoyl-CoA hydratase [Pseudonocardia acidicola]
MINVSAKDDVGLIELDRPERRNALDVAQCRRLVDAMADLQAQGVRAVVVTGAGSSFCSGADFGEVYTDGFRDALYAALHAIHDAGLPVVAAVNGPAIGAGTQLAIACDLRVAAPGAVFGVPTARIGLAVDPWTVRRLAQLGGGGTARSLLLACDQIGAELAHARGLADRLGDRDDALALAAELATLAPLTLAYNKLTLDRTELPENDPALLAAFEGCWSSEDIEEGRRARVEKRSPRFSGR